MDASIAARREFLCRRVISRRLRPRLRRPPRPEPRPARAQRPPPPPSPDRFRGVRIFDISDLSNPKQVAAVQSCRGSHTHTLVIDPKDKENVYIYISGTGVVRQAEELAGCSGGDPATNPEHRAYSASTSSRCRWRTRSRRRSFPARASLPTRKPEPSMASGRAAITGKARRPHRKPTNAMTSRSIRPSDWLRARVPAMGFCWTYPIP